MRPTDSGVELLRQVVAPSNAIFPNELRSRAYDEMGGRLAWRPDDAEHAIRILESSGAAIMEGQLWIDDGQDRGFQIMVEVDGAVKSHIWHCPREAEEDWAAFVRRAADTARKNVPQAAKIGSELKSLYETFIRLSWVTEEQPSLYDLPPVVRVLSDEASAHGSAPWAYIGLAGNTLSVDVRRSGPTSPGSFYSARSVTSLADVPTGAAFLRVITKTVRDLERLTDFHALETLEIYDVGDRELEIVSRLPSIRLLSISVIRSKSLDALATLSRLEHLKCDDSGTLTNLAALSGLDRLRTLGLMHLRKMKYLEEASRLIQLRGLTVSGSMWSHARVPTLAPLAKLRNLRSLHLTGVRVEDGSLSTLTTMKNLRDLTLANWFSTEEFAKLAAALPDLNAPGYQSMWWIPPRPAHQSDWDACDRCKAFTRGMTIGKPAKKLCPRCDEAKIAKFAARWDALVEAART